MSKYKAGDVVVVVDNTGASSYYQNGEICTVEWVDKGIYNEEDDILRCVGKEAGMFAFRFKLASEVIHNGVDSAGNPLNFTEGLLQPFQRVVDRAGRTWIVGPKKPNGKYALLGSGDCVHTEFANTEEECSGLSGYIADEVYDMPMYYDALDHAKKGNLIWKRTKPLTEQEKAVQQLENTIKEAQAKLEALKATL